MVNGNNKGFYKIYLKFYVLKSYKIKKHTNRES